MDAFPFKLYSYGTFENCTWLKPQLFHPHKTILCTTDAIRGFCGFNSITCSKHYKDNIEVLNRQRFTENPGVFFSWGKEGGGGGGGGEGGGRGCDFFLLVCFLYFYYLIPRLND